MLSPLLKSKRWRYSIALGLVALLSLTAYLMLRQVISTQHGNASKVNLSGRQRMLSQRAALFSSLLVLSQAPLSKSEIRGTLKNTIDLLEYSHENLVDNDATRKIDTDVRTFIADVRTLLATRDQDLNPKLSVYKKIITDASSTLLLKLDGAVTEYQQESEDQVQLLEKLEAVVLLLTLLLLVLEARFIFRPLYEQTIRAEEASKMAALGQMASAIGHEILNPISNISLSADWLMKQLKHPPLDPSQLEAGVSKIKAATYRVSKIITGLRHFAHSSESEQSRTTRLRTLIDETLDFALPRFRQGKVELKVKPFREDLMIEIKPVQISQVLINLLNNAYDAVSPLASDRWVALEVRETPDEVTIAVSNGGPMIPEEVREKIGTGFYTTKPPEQGTGMGLTISKRIIDAHRGHLEIEKETRNTTFSVSIPKGKESTRAG